MKAKKYEEYFKIKYFRANAVHVFVRKRGKNLLFLIETNGAAISIEKITKYKRMIMAIKLNKINKIHILLDFIFYVPRGQKESSHNG